MPFTEFRSTGDPGGESVGWKACETRRGRLATGIASLGTGIIQQVNLLDLGLRTLQVRAALLSLSACCLLLQNAEGPAQHQLCALQPMRRLPASLPEAHARDRRDVVGLVGRSEPVARLALPPLPLASPGIPRDGPGDYMTLMTVASPVVLGNVHCLLYVEFPFAGHPDG